MSAKRVIYPMAHRSGRGSSPSDLERDVGHDYRRAVGRYLQEQRLKRGLTQLDVATELGVRDTAISAIELGRNAVSPERYGVMADVLGLERRKFGKFLLRHYDPWLHALIFPAEVTEDELAAIPERLTDRRQKPDDNDPSAATGRRGH